MSNPNNRNDWFLKHQTNVDPVLFNIYNGAWLRNDDRRGSMNNKILNRNLINLCNNESGKFDINKDSEIKNIDCKCDNFRFV